MSKARDILSRLVEEAVRVSAVHKLGSGWDDMAQGINFIAKHEYRYLKLAYYADSGRNAQYIIAYQGDDNSSDILKAANLPSDNIDTEKLDNILFITSA